MSTTATVPTYSPYFTEEHQMLRDQIRKFVEQEVIPNGEKWEEEGKVPREVLRKLGDMGILGIRVPEEYGGSGLDVLASVALAEEMARGTFGGFAISVLVHTDMASPHLVRYGSEELKRRFLPGIVSGEKITAIAVTEPDAGSDVAGIRTRADRDGDHYVLNGAKTFITNAYYGDVVFVAAKTNREAKDSRSMSIFLVERGTPGFTATTKLAKTGWLCSDTAELRFENCRIPAENLVGEEHRGFYSIMHNFQNERLIIAAMAVGESLKAIEMTVEQVRTRKAFGAPLWDKQGIRQRLAMRAAETEAARELLYHAAWMESRGMDCVKEVSMVKALAAETAQRVMYDCVQFHGGMGYMRESAIERMSRDARIHSIGGGATEVMLEEVAKRL
jgi:acyl-CoA dehydrogenase